MPMHDWTRVSDGIFHHFHHSWVVEIKRALRRGLLSEGYYVMAEQIRPDLRAPNILLAIGLDPTAPLPRTVVIRHRSDDRIVAMIEVLSPSNKSSLYAIRSFLDKTAAALNSGIHVRMFLRNIKRFSTPPPE